MTRQSTNGYDIGNKASQWITKYLNHDACAPFRILFHPYNPKGDKTNVRENGLVSVISYFIPNAKADDSALYADLYGFLLTTKESLAELNKHLEQRDTGMVADMRRFRPNIVLEGTKTELLFNF